MSIWFPYVSPWSYKEKEHGVLFYHTIQSYGPDVIFGVSHVWQSYFFNCLPRLVDTYRTRLQMQ